MTNEVSNKIKKLISAGFTGTVLQALGALQGTSTLAYFTPIDITRKILSSFLPVTKHEYHLVANRVKVILTKGVELNRHSLFESNGKISTSVQWDYKWPAKASIGYRIGATISTPVINSDIHSEKCAGIVAASEFNRNPAECVKDMMTKLTDAQLTEVIGFANSLKDEKILTLRVEILNLRKENEKVKSNAEAALETALAKIKSEE